MITLYPATYGGDQGLTCRRLIVRSAEDFSVSSPFAAMRFVVTFAELSPVKARRGRQLNAKRKKEGMMAIERCYSVRKAAKAIGVTPRYLVCMLRVDLGLVLPPVPRGAHQMIRESVLDQLIDKRGPKTDLLLLRYPSQRRKAGGSKSQKTG